MAKKSKKYKNEKSDLIRYFGNKMTDKERNAFEKRLQKEPFESDAAEGLALIGPDDADADLQILSERLANKVVSRRSPLIYRIAAAVIILITVSSVFLVKELRKPAPVYSENVGMVEDEHSEAPTEFVKSEAEVEASTPVKTTADRKVEVEEAKAEAEIEAPTPVKTKADRKVEAEEENIISGVQVAAPAVSRAAKEITIAEVKEDQHFVGGVSGKVLSADDSLPLPGVTIIVKGEGRGTMTDIDGSFKIMTDSSDILTAQFIGMQSKEVAVTDKKDIGAIMLEPDNMALEEVVVVGYGQKGKAAGVQTGAVSEIEMDKGVPEYISPKPSSGMTDFMEYIKEEQVYPDSYTDSDRVVIRVKFTVGVSGEIYDIIIIKSPDEVFNREVKRLINSGPGWLPATMDGLNIEDIVRLRIVFHR